MEYQHAHRADYSHKQNHTTTHTQLWQEVSGNLVEKYINEASHYNLPPRHRSSGEHTTHSNTTHAHAQNGSALNNENRFSLPVDRTTRTYTHTHRKTIHITYVYYTYRFESVQCAVFFPLLFHPAVPVSGGWGSIFIHNRPATSVWKHCLVCMFSDNLKNIWCIGVQIIYNDGNWKFV